MDMAKSRIEIQNLADRLLQEAGIEPCFKPMVSRLVASQGLQVVPALNLATGEFSSLKLNGVEQNGVFSRMNCIVSVNASRDEKEQRLATVYQVAFFVLHKDLEGQYESHLTASALHREDDDAMRLACALLMNRNLFLDKFKRAMKGIPNRVAVCKNLSAQFGVPEFSVEQRAKELDLPI